MEKKKNKAKYLFLVFGIIIFVIYFLPVFGRILNVGNILGMAVGLALILVFIFYKRIKELFKKLSSSKLGKCFVVLFLTVIIAFVSLFTVTLAKVVFASRYTAKDEKTVIVLGCLVYGTEPSNQLKSRCNVAADYLLNHPEAVAILTGGQGEDEDISEAECLFNMMTEKGIDENRLFIEDRSTSTDENIAFAKMIIEENGLSTDVAIATSSYNEKRASVIAEKYSLTAASIPAYSGFWSIPTYFTREVFALWALKLFG
jgi:uncharacterized SAM-binding protein YcdF (DUF218 family)